jgi:uncharacterized protein YjiS (DUF1127 family)
MKSDLPLGPCDEMRWNRIRRKIAAWRHVARSRRELMNLSDRALSDIGFQGTRIESRTAHVAQSKSLWMT